MARSCYGALSTGARPRHHCRGSEWRHLQRLWGFGQLHSYLLAAAAAVNREFDRVARPLAADRALEGVAAFHGLTVDGRNEVAADAESVVPHDHALARPAQAGFL